VPDKKPLDKFPSPSNGNRSPEPQKSALISTLMLVAIVVYLSFTMGVNRSRPNEHRYACHQRVRDRREGRSRLHGHVQDRGRQHHGHVLEVGRRCGQLGRPRAVQERLRGHRLPCRAHGQASQDHVQDRHLVVEHPRDDSHLGGAHRTPRGRLRVLHASHVRPERPDHAVWQDGGPHHREGTTGGQVLRGGYRRGRRGAQGGPRLPARTRALPEDGRQDSAWRAARRPSGHGQDAPRQGRGRRGGRTVLLDLRLGLRGDVRGRGRLARPRPLQAGQGLRSLHHLHRRDRRGVASAVLAWAAVTTSASRP